MENGSIVHAVRYILLDYFIAVTLKEYVSPFRHSSAFCKVETLPFISLQSNGFPSFPYSSNVKWRQIQFGNKIGENNEFVSASIFSENGIRFCAEYWEHITLVHVLSQRMSTWMQDLFHNSLATHSFWVNSKSYPTQGLHGPTKSMLRKKNIFWFFKNLYHILKYESVCTY